MKSNNKQLGNYIQLVDQRNSDLSITNLLGVSIEKKFIPSIANIVGTDLSNYKIVRTGQFAYGPVTSRNGEKISIAYLDGEDCIISSSYTVFEVNKKDELDPEYLMLWFSRPEFDRYARYKSHGSVREIFDWTELCLVELPVPSIEEQRKIVKAYKTITDRIALKKQINDNLAAEVQALFVKMFGVYTSDISVIKERSQTVFTMDDCCSFISKGVTPQYTDDERIGEIILNQRCINNNQINFGFCKRHIPKSKNEKWLQYGDILINSTGTGTLGRSAQYWGESSDITVDSHITIMRPKNDALIYYLGTLCQMLQSTFENMQTGSTAQTDLPRERLKAMILGLPNDEQLTAFNSIAEKVVVRLQENLREVSLLQELQRTVVATLSSH